MDTKCEDKTEYSLDDFSLIQKLGQGNHGIVSLVQSRIDNKEYVIKQIELNKIKIRYGEEGVKQSLFEASILRKVKHQNIIGYSGSFVQNKVLYIIMEYAPYGDLSSLIQKQKQKRRYVPEHKVWSYLFHLCSGLKYLQTKRILHRDLKPQNILIGREKILKIGDLGICAHLRRGDVIAEAGIGTPLYQAPEIIQGIPYDYKIDVWSLGCLLYYLIALRPPFSGSDMADLSFQIVHADPPPLPSCYSIVLIDLILSMMTKIPDERPSIDQILKCIPPSFLSRKDAKSKMMNEITISAKLTQSASRNQLKKEKQRPKSAHSAHKKAFSCDTIRIYASLEAVLGEPTSSEQKNASLDQCKDLTKIAVKTRDVSLDSQIVLNSNVHSQNHISDETDDTQPNDLTSSQMLRDKYSIVHSNPHAHTRNSPHTKLKTSDIVNTPDVSNRDSLNSEGELHESVEISHSVRDNDLHPLCQSNEWPQKPFFAVRTSGAKYNNYRCRTISDSQLELKSQKTPFTANICQDLENDPSTEYHRANSSKRRASQWNSALTTHAHLQSRDPSLFRKRNLLCTNETLSDSVSISHRNFTEQSCTLEKGFSLPKESQGNSAPKSKIPNVSPSMISNCTVRSAEILSRSKLFDQQTASIEQKASQTTASMLQLNKTTMDNFSFRDNSYLSDSENSIHVQNIKSKRKDRLGLSDLRSIIQ